MTGGEKPSTVMARKACPREGGERAIQAMKDSFGARTCAGWMVRSSRTMTGKSESERDTCITTSN